MRIDAHQHFWDLERFAYPWMPPGDSPLRRNHLPEDLGPILREHRFDGSVTVQATTDPGEADWLLSLARDHSFVLGVVAWVDLTGPQLASRLDQLQRHGKFKGVRHPVHDEADDGWLLRPDVVAGLRELERRRIPFDLLIRPRHLPAVIELIEQVPSLPLVIDHLAKPPITAGSLDGWAEDMARIASIPHVHVKLSGLVTEAGPHWKPQDLSPFLFHVFRHFTADRLMYGSDWPVCKLGGATWKRALAAFTQAHGPLPSELRSKLIGETAERFYGLEVPEPEASTQKREEPGAPPA